MNYLGSSSSDKIVPRHSWNVESPSTPFQDKYPHFLQWKYQVMNLEGSTSDMVLAQPDQAPNVP